MHTVTWVVENIQMMVLGFYWISLHLHLSSSCPLAHKASVQRRHSVPSFATFLAWFHDDHPMLFLSVSAVLKQETFNTSRGETWPSPVVNWWRGKTWNIQLPCIFIVVGVIFSVGRTDISCIYRLSSVCHLHSHVTLPLLSAVTTADGGGQMAE